jgi:hypothetical protein
MAGAGRFRSWGGAATTAWEIRVRWGHLMQLKLSDLEIELLRKLVNGEAVSLSSQQRVRLELAGMIREGPKGIVVTLTGRNLAREKLAHASASDAGPNVNVSRDRRGRRMPFQRKSIF